MKLTKIILSICLLTLSVVLSFSACGKSKTVNITFVQDGEEDIVKTIERGGDLLDIPTPKEIEGYEVSWSVEDFTNISEDLTVSVKKVGKFYKITFDANGGTMDFTELDVQFGENITLPVPTNEGFTLVKWEIVGTNERLKNGAYNIAKDVSVKAVWEVATWTPGWV